MKKMTRLARDTTWLLFSACITLFACEDCHAIAPGVSPKVLTVSDQSGCVSACDNFKSLSCPEANPVNMGTSCKADADCLGPDGKHDQYQTCSLIGGCMVTCANFCLATEAQGVELNPSCIAQATTCAQADACVASGDGGTSCVGTGCKVAPH